MITSLNCFFFYKEALGFYCCLFAYEQSFYFYRDSNHHEIDLIFKTGNNLIPIEIKSSKTFHPDFLKDIIYFQALSEGRSPLGILMYGGDQEQRIKSIQVYHFTQVKEAIVDIFAKLK